MNCLYEHIDTAKSGRRVYRCPQCGHQRESRYPAEKLHRNCPAGGEVVPVISLDENFASIQANGPTRTNSEVLVTITNFCTTCPAWNPAAEKKKCKYCGCGSSDTVENLHKRRIRNCPKGHWTEASLQRYLHSESTPDPLAPSKPTPELDPSEPIMKNDL